MTKRISLFLAPIALLLFAIAVFALMPNESNQDSRNENKTPNSAGSQHGGFLNFFVTPNPKTGEIDSKTKADTLRRLAEKYPENNFLRSILNPSSGGAMRKQLYAMAGKIQSGRATPEQIKEYYGIRRKEIADQMEILSEVPDQSKVKPYIDRLRSAGESLNLIRDKMLKQAQQRGKK